MEKELKDKIDATIEEGVKEAKAETEKSESVVKRSIAFAPPQIIRKVGKEETFSYARLIKAMATNRWAEAPFEKEAIEKTNQFPVPHILNEATGSYAGYMIPPEYSMELIDSLNAEAVVRRAGASIYPMTRDTLYIPKLTTNAACTWGAEGAQLADDQTMVFDQVQIDAKKLYCFIGISNETLADSSPAVETVVRRDMVRQIALAEDACYIRGNASASSPTGLIYYSGTANDPVVCDGSSSLLGSSQKLYAGGNTQTAGGAVIIYDDILDIMYLVESNNAKVSGFIMHPRTKNALRKIQDSNGQYIYAIHPEQKVPDTLYGLPVFLTTQMPIVMDGTSGNDCNDLSAVICGDFSEAIIGQRQGLELAVSEHVGFYSDTTWLRATLRVGFKVKHAAAFGVLLDVQ